VNNTELNLRFKKNRTNVMASENSVKPSTQATKTSLLPRFFSSVITKSQNLAPSFSDSIERFEEQTGQYLQELQQQLKTGAYQSQAVKRVNIPKVSGGTRPLGIPTVKDRVVQMAIKLVIKPIFEHIFRDSSHDFRPERGCKDVLTTLSTLRKGELKSMDGFVRRRLRSILRKYQKKGVGTGRNIQDHQKWTNAYFASLGLFTMYEAHAEASRAVLLYPYSHMDVDAGAT